MIKRILTLFIFSHSGPFTSGQNANDTIVIMAGDKAVNALHCRPYINTWNMYRETADGNMQLQGQWFDTVVILKRNGKSILQRRQTARYVNGISRIHFDETYMENLFPIHTIIKSRNKDSTIILGDVYFKGNHIEGFRYFNTDGTGEPAEIKSKFYLEPERPVYEWHLWGILISGFPLKDNYAARFLTHTTPGYNNSPFLWVTLSVTGTDTISSKNFGKVECWKVSVKAEAPWTFWISKKAGPPPIQQIKIEEPGNSALWWKPVND